jgi:hypothetical protein
MDACKWVDEEIIELHAMGRLEDGFIREHFEYCKSCAARVVESRVWIDKLRRGLRDLQETKEIRAEANDDDSNRQDES